MILDEVRRDVFERPKPTLDLDYLYSIKKQVQDLSDQTNSQLKKNVYQNYSIFIETSRQISTLKSEMKELNGLLDKQQTSINKFMDQLNKTSITPSSLDKPKMDTFRLELNDEANEVEAEILPSWFIKSPEDFDVLIAQRNLKEAVELAQMVKSHFDQYPKCCENAQHADLKIKIDSRMKELVNAICSELQPSTDRSVQGGPRSSVASIQLLRGLNLSAKAVKLYLDQRSSLLSFVLKRQKVESTSSSQFIKQMCSIFFHNIIETCNEFKHAFEIDKHVEEGAEKLVLEKRFGDLAIYSTFIYWSLQECENFILFFKENVFNNGQLSMSMISESVFYFTSQCSKLAKYCGINMSTIIERQLDSDINKVILDTENKLFETIKKLDNEEQWQPQQFQNSGQMTRFFEEMNDVDLKTMPSYIFDDHKLRFTACKTAFARYYLLTIKDLAKVSILSVSNQLYHYNYLFD